MNLYNKSSHKDLTQEDVRQCFKKDIKITLYKLFH